MFKRAHWMVFMDAAAGDGGGGAGGGGDGGAAAAGAAGTGGAAGDGGSAAAAGSVMGGGAGGAGAGDGGQAGATTTGTDYFPEKFRVSKDDGTVDVEASARKLAESYGNLERSRGEAAPKTAGEYTVTVPEAMKEAIGDVNADPTFVQFRDEMHSLGLNQKQFDGIMTKYFQMVPELVAGGAQVSAENTSAELQKLWPDQAKFKENIGLSYRAATSVAKAAGMSFADIEKSGLGNNPTFIRLMAAIGPEMAEDASPDGSASGGGFATETEIQRLMASEANTNVKHVDHKATRAKIDAFYARKYGDTPIA